jgi:hypothetical protein
MTTQKTKKQQRKKVTAKAAIVPLWKIPGSGVDTGMF